MTANPNPYLSVIRKFHQKRVRFVLVGVFGINHYAPSPAAAYSTLDCDILAEPSPENLLNALKTLESDGYVLEATGEPLGKPDAWLAGKIIRAKAAVTAIKNKSAQIDILTSVAGYSFAKLYAGKRLFRAGGISVPVASLAHLLGIKRICGRKKDLEFLRVYQSQLASLKIRKILRQ
ncbi:MAG: hypothetical protein HY796_10735 [Elusimicrobia bacterium]|nr:hypothetical protein [Elusimicrobiota bacterium]